VLADDDADRVAEALIEVLAEVWAGVPQTS
jgi:hypothetical protein